MLTSGHAEIKPWWLLNIPAKVLGLNLQLSCYLIPQYVIIVEKATPVLLGGGAGDCRSQQTHKVHQTKDLYQWRSSGFESQSSECKAKQYYETLSTGGLFYQKGEH